MDGSLLPKADPIIIMSYINNGIKRVVLMDWLALTLWWLVCGEMGSQLQVSNHMTTFFVCGLNL